MEEKPNENFWNDGETIKINHYRLINFISWLGYVRVKVDNNNTLLAKVKDNRMSITKEADIANDIKEFLIKEEKENVLEVFIRGIAGYINSKKLDLLPSIDLIQDRDTAKQSYFFFKNVYVIVTKEETKLCSYDSLKFPIWENRILSHEFNMPDTQEGQFEKFCRNITGNDDDRFKGLKTMLGYLLHRNKEFGEPRAVILYDSELNQNGNANGGTGKTLLSVALSKCRQVEIFDAKDLKIGSFKNQRIELNTDVIVYDDLKKDYSFEQFFPLITSGVEVEKKGKQSFMIPHDSSPKLLISSNYIVKGPGGSSDKRRRYEFELLNYYNHNFTPEMEFGNKFFGEAWSIEEWNKFYFFMMSCVSQYLLSGLQKVNDINLNISRLAAYSSPEFVDYIQTYVPCDEWYDKRESMDEFKILFPEYQHLKPHTYHKWLVNYSDATGLLYEDKSTGGNYKFIFKTNGQTNINFF